MTGSNPSADLTDQPDEAETLDPPNRPFGILARYEDQRSPPPVNRSITDSSVQKGRGWFLVHWFGSLWRSQEHDRDDETPNTSKNAGKTTSQSEKSTRTEELGWVSVRNDKRASTFPRDKVRQGSSRTATFPTFREDGRSNAPGELQRNHRNSGNVWHSTVRQRQRLRESLSHDSDISPKTTREPKIVKDHVSRSPQRPPSVQSTCSNQRCSPAKVFHNETPQGRSFDHPASQPQDVLPIPSDVSHADIVKNESSFTEQHESPPEVDLKTVEIFANQAARDSGYLSQSTKPQAIDDSRPGALPVKIEPAAGRSFTTISMTTDHLKMPLSEGSVPEDVACRDVQGYTTNSPIELLDPPDFRPVRRRRDSQQTSMSELSNEYTGLRFEDFDTSAMCMGGQFPEYDCKSEIDEDMQQVDNIDENDRRMVEKRKRDLAPVLTLSASKGTGHSGTFESLLDPEIPSRSLGYGVAHWMLQKFICSWTELCRFIRLSTISSSVCSSVENLSSLVGYIHLDALVCANWFWDANTITCSGGKSTGQRRAMTSHVPSIDSASIDVPYLYTQIFVENSDAGSGEVEIYHLSRRIHQPEDTQEAPKSPEYMNTESPSYPLEDRNYRMSPIAISLGTSPSTSPHPSSRSPQSLRSRVSSRHESFSYSRPWITHHSAGPTQ